MLLSRLGYGGMAEVFLARTDGIGGFEKKLAIKRLLPYYTEDEQTVELLADEAKITVRLSHPSIVQVFDFGRVESHYFIAMEYIDGLDLKSLVEIDEYTSAPMPLDVALFVSISVLDALDYAHNRIDDHGNRMNIIHRDVSPQNVLISRHGQVKLTDFGVARAAIQSHVSVIGDIRGKFSYMPPEQACGGEIDHRVDIFAAGAILYELLTGHQPYRSASSGQQMAQLRQELTPPSELRPELPRVLDDITRRALALDQEQRFTSARDFANALGEALDLRTDPLGPQRRLAAMVETRLAGDVPAASHGDGAMATRSSFADDVSDPAQPSGPLRTSASGEIGDSDASGAQRTMVAIPSRKRQEQPGRDVAPRDYAAGVDEYESDTDEGYRSRRHAEAVAYDEDDFGARLRFDEPEEEHALTADVETFDQTLTRDGNSANRPLEERPTLAYEGGAMALGMAPTQLLVSSEQSDEIEGDSTRVVDQPSKARRDHAAPRPAAAAKRPVPEGEGIIDGADPELALTAPQGIDRASLRRAAKAEPVDRRVRMERSPGAAAPAKEPAPPRAAERPGGPLTDLLRARPGLFYGVMAIIVLLIGILIGALVAVV